MGSEVSGKAALASSWAWMRPGHTGGCGDGLWDVAASFPFAPVGEQPGQGWGLAVMVKAGCENHHSCASNQVAKSLVTFRERSL